MLTRRDPPLTRQQKLVQRQRRMRSMAASVQPREGVVYGGATAGPAPKDRAYRDPVLLEMQAGRPCKLLALTSCLELSGDRTTTVACHENQGKGMGIKAGDQRSVGGCYRCHAWYDRSGAPRAEKRLAFMAAHLRQVLEWRQIAVDPQEPERFRKAAKRALEHLNATPLPMESTA